MKKKHGWILQAVDGRFVNEAGDDVLRIKSARVFSTRRQARTGDRYIVKLNDDIVRKVKVDKQGKAVKIIPGR